MKYKWLNQNKNTDLILFFNGWGMDESVVKHLVCGNYDVVMFYDYNSIETDFFDKYNIEVYEEINIIGWSMGVMICAYIIQSYNIRADKITVINGTLKPIDADYGINPKIYDLTIRGFNENSKNRFVKNMFNSSVPSQIEKIERSIDNLKNELISIKNFAGKFNLNPIKPSKIVICNEDKIIPAKSQSKYWGIAPNYNAGHCPFFTYSSWEELL